MDLLIILFIVALIGCSAYLITQFLPMDPIFKTAINILAIVFVILYLFRIFGGHIPNVL